MNEILELDVGLTLGLLNEKSNQISDLNKKDKEEEVVQGTADMLMKM